MLEFYKKRWKNDKSIVFLLLIYVSLLLCCIYLSINHCFDEPFALENLVYLLFSIVSIVKIVIGWRRFIKAEIKKPDEEVTERNISFEEWRQAILKNELSQMPYKAIAVLMLFIAIAIISAAIVFRDEIFTVSYTKDANYDRLSNLSNISIAIALLFEDIPELFEIEQKVFKQISTLLSIIFIFTSLTLFVSSANYITEMAR